MCVVKVAANNIDGLLLCWYFIMSGPEPKPIGDQKMKLTTKAHLYPEPFFSAKTGKWRLKRDLSD
jgi:hypothetical protein